MSAAHIIWDWNGTLLDDTPLNIASVNAVMRDFSVPEVDLNRWTEVLTRPLWVSYARLIGRELTREEWVRIEKVWNLEYSRGSDSLRLVADATRALALAREAGLGQSILSLAPQIDVDRYTRRLGIEHYFDIARGRRELVAGEGKSTAMVQHIRELGIDPAQVVMIGDVADDMVAAASAGAQAIGVTTGIGSVQMLQAAGCPVATSLTEAVSLALGQTGLTARFLPGQGA